MKLLHIDSSALGAHSVSRELSAAIVDAWKRREPGLEITYRDLAANPLPHWLPVTDATSMPAGDPLAEFLAADVIVIGAPMYNFGIASQLKAWIDRIVIAGKTFQYGANGVEGLAGGRKVVIASARGGFYGADTAGQAADFQETYLRHIFSFIGITDIDFVRAEGIATGAEQRAKALNEAHAEIETRLPVAA
jgi:FMN-dependent NADH-azoreductase